MKKHILAILLIIISLIIVYRGGNKKVRKSETPIENNYTKWASLLQNTSNYEGNSAVVTLEDGRMIIGTREYPSSRQGRIRFILALPSSHVRDPEKFELKFIRKRSAMHVILNENIEDKATYAFYYANGEKLNKKQIQDKFKIEYPCYFIRKRQGLGGIVITPVKIIQTLEGEYWIELRLTSSGEYNFPTIVPPKSQNY